MDGFEYRMVKVLKKNKGVMYRCVNKSCGVCLSILDNGVVVRGSGTHRHKTTAVNLRVDAAIQKMLQRAGVERTSLVKIYQQECALLLTEGEI